mgnify:CR=1 FL=1
MKPGMHVDNLHVERTSRFEQEKNGKDNIMIETMQWVRPEEIEARSMAIIEAEMPEGNWTPDELTNWRIAEHTFWVACS